MIKAMIPGRPLSRGLGLLAAGIAFALPLGASAEVKGLIGKDPETVKQVQAWNAQCLACHVGDSLHAAGKGLFSVPKGQDDAVRVSPSFAASNHGAMACKTCHVGAFSNYPHTAGNGEMKAQTLHCDECHAQETFRIEQQVAKSVHSKNLAEQFTCSSCHDPHVATSAKRLGDAHKVVAQDNGMCLDCHNSDEKFAAFGGTVLPDKKRPDIDQIHDWLPNTQRHWASARCVDCHTPAVSEKSSLALSHQILDKEEARRECVSCHSQDSALRTTLYRHIKEQDTKEMGFANAAFLRSSYVIGATRNEYLDLLGLLMVGGTIAGVSLHGLLRIIARRRRKS